MNSDEIVEALRDLLNNYKVYSIATALRGSDTENQSLKRLFTARIRCLVGIKPSITTTRIEKCIDINDLVDALVTTSRFDVHFIEHVMDALISLHRLGLMDFMEFQALYMLASTLEEVAKSTDVLGYVTDVDRFSKAVYMVMHIVQQFPGIICS